MSVVLSLPPNLEGPLETVVVLPKGNSGADIARKCREAAVDFMNESARWGKPELAMWLTGPYSLLAHAKDDTPSLMGGAPLIKSIDVRIVERVIRAARKEVHDALMQLCVEQSSSFVLRALIAGTVMRCEDEKGDPAWGPVGTASTRLADRVLSLFAVDYLARPGDYEELAVCATCSWIAFDAGARSRGYCGMHAPPSQRRGLTVPYYPGMPSFEV